MRILLYRLLAACAAAVMLAGCGGYNHDVPLVLSTILSGEEQVPPNDSRALASGTVTVDRDNRFMIVSVLTRGIAPTEVHLHSGSREIAGPVITPLTPGPVPTLWAGSIMLTDAQLDALKAGNFYFDVHSAAFPAGELRGQLEDAFPPQEHVDALQQVAAQSPLLAEQLGQLQDYEDWWHGDHDGAFIGLFFGF